MIKLFLDRPYSEPAKKKRGKGYTTPKLCKKAIKKLKARGKYDIYRVS